MTMMNLASINQETASTKSNTVDAKADLANQILDMVNSGMSGELSEEKRQKMDAKILAKLESGKKLSAKEMQYLRKYNPVLYAKALRIQLKIKHLEEQLKHAKSKEEVTNIEMFAVGSVSKKDPDRKLILAAINSVMQDFKSSQAYQSLPATEEEEKRAKNNWKPKEAEDEEEEEDEDSGSNRGTDICYSTEYGGYQVRFVHHNTTLVLNMTT